VRITIGGNLINYLYKLTTCTADMISTKIMWNSVISTPGAKIGGADIKNMYLKTPLDQYKYMQMSLKLFPDDIINHYNLCEKALNGYVYGNLMQYVRFTTSWHLGKQAPMPTPGTTWLLRSTAHAQSLETRLPSHLV
jgi:hypothetical protein